MIAICSRRNSGAQVEKRSVLESRKAWRAEKLGEQKSLVSTTDNNGTYTSLD
jgi:hypothetical protein